MKSKKNKISNNFNDYFLWVNIRNGNKLSYCLFFRRYFPLLIGYGKSLYPFEEKVESCVQDVFVDIWVYRNYLNYNINVKMFLLLIVYKKIKNLQNRNDVSQKSINLCFVSSLVDFYDKTNSILDKKVEKS